MLTPDNGINMWREAQPHTQVSMFFLLTSGEGVSLAHTTNSIYEGLTKEVAS